MTTKKHRTSYTLFDDCLISFLLLVLLLFLQFYIKAKEIICLLEADERPNERTPKKKKKKKNDVKN